MSDTTSATSIDHTVWTTTGPITVAEMGRTLYHEHVLIIPPGADLDPISTFTRAEIVVRAIDALSELHGHGVQTVVDPCPIEQGRDVEMLAEVASRSGVRVICATGFYLQTDGRGIPYYWRHQPVEAITELFLSELENGVAGTGIRPGVIKAATGLEVGEHERTVFLAAGRASAASGVPVTTHTEKSLHALVQTQMLEAAGADLRRCVIGHLDNLDLAQLQEVAVTGVNVGVDRIGWDTLGDDGHRVELVTGMFRAGLGSQLCLSQDRCATYLSPRPQFFVPHKSREYVDNVHWPALQRDTTTKGFAFLFDHFIPRLLETGMTQVEIDRMLIDTPRRLFGGGGTPTPH